MSYTIYVPFWKGERKPDIDCVGFTTEEVYDKLHVKYNMVYKTNRKEIASVFNVVRVVVENEHG